MKPDNLTEQRARQRRVIEYLNHHAGSPGIEAQAVRETHLSWLFFTADRVLKLKKPLHYSYLDYSTMQARAQQCEAEVRLNQRLAPDVYLGVLTVSELADGSLVTSRDGVPLEYVVEMQRLAESANLEVLLRDDGLEAARADALGAALAGFYDHLTGLAVDPGRYVGAQRGDTEHDLGILARPSYGLDGRRIKRLSRALQQLVDELEPALSARIGDGRLVEGHGDLRPEHVYFAPGPKIIDCLEFSRPLRTMDAAEELGFLAMECDRLGAGWLGRRVLAHYSRVTGDEPEPRLMAFFMARRAVLWARLAISHLAREPERDRDKWVARANAYLGLAAGYVG